jgi:hypothetical protein
MFGVFSAHAAKNCVLMFNIGPSHGESISSYGGHRQYLLKRALLRAVRAYLIVAGHLAVIPPPVLPGHSR